MDPPLSFNSFMGIIKTDETTGAKMINIMEKYFNLSVLVFAPVVSSVYIIPINEMKLSGGSN